MKIKCFFKKKTNTFSVFQNQIELEDYSERFKVGNIELIKNKSVDTNRRVKNINDNIENLKPMVEDDILKAQLDRIEKEIQGIKRQSDSQVNQGNVNNTNNASKVPTLTEKGTLEVQADVPKSLEELKQDIFVEVVKANSTDPSHDVFYLSLNNNFKNNSQLEVGDYRVKKIYFLNNDLDGLYDFEYNDIMKVLPNERTFFNINVKDNNFIDVFSKEEKIDELEASLENKEEEEIEEDQLEKSLELEANKKEKKKSLFIFLITITLIVIFIVWKFDLVNKIIYKE